MVFGDYFVGVVMMEMVGYYLVVVGYLVQFVGDVVEQVGGVVV